MATKGSKSSQTKVVQTKKRKVVKHKTPNWFLQVFKYLGLGIWFLFKGLWWIFKQLGTGIWLLAQWIVSSAAKQKSKKIGRKKSAKEFPDLIKTLNTLEGSFALFWKKLKTSDSLIGIIVGARGSGKSAIALTIMEELQGTKENYYAMGFKSADLPNWINVVEDINELQNNSLVVVDEGGILFSSRSSMSDSNKFLSELLFVARHKDLTILFISQNSSNIEINTLRQADFIILKKSSLLQKDFERKKISEIYTNYADGFKKYKSVKGATLIYSDEYIGFVKNDLPIFWSTKVSKGFRDK